MVQMNVTAGVDSPSPPPAVGPLVASADWPVRSGPVPPLADRFSTRPETGPDVAMALERSPTIALVPRSRRVGAGSSHDWLRCSGKTQQAVFFAESQWRTRSIELLVWVDASSTASILSGYVEAARVLTGTRLPGNAESVAASFLGWLGRTDRRWLVVLDDLPDVEVLQGLWPSGPTGQVVITTANTQAMATVHDVLVVEIGPFSRREAMSYLVGRLSSDPDQRRGAIDLIEDLDCQPLALAHATAAIGSSWMTCVEYREQFHRRLAVFNPPEGQALPATSVTWTLSVDHADQLLPGGFAQSCLAIAAMLDGHGVPASVFSAPSACAYIAGSAVPAGQAAERTRMALVVLEQAGLIGIDRSTEPPIVRMSPILQRAVRVAMSPNMVEQSALAAAAALLESWPEGERGTWLGQSLRASASCPAARHRRPAVGQRPAPAAPARRAEPGRCVPNRSCGRLLDPAHLDRRPGIRARPPRLDGRRREARERLRDRRPGLRGRGLVSADHGRLGPGVRARPSADTGRAGPAGPCPGDGRALRGRDCRADGRAERRRACLRARPPGVRDHQGRGRGRLPRCRRAHRGIRLYRLILGERERSLGSQHPDTMQTRQLLAEAYLADGRTKEAFSQYKKAVSDLQRSQGPDHPDTLRARGALGAAYHQAGRMPMAVQMYEQVHASLVRVLGADHPDTLSAALNLGRVYYAVGRLTDAGAMLSDTVARGERVLAPADPLTKAARESLAAIVGEPAH